MIAVMIVYIAANDKKQKLDYKNIKTIQRQDRDDTVLLIATREQQNIDTKITRLEQNINNSEQRSSSNILTRK